MKFHVLHRQADDLCRKAFEGNKEEGDCGLTVDVIMCAIYNSNKILYRVNV